MTVGICTEFVDYCEYNTFTEQNIYETEYKNLRLLPVMPINIFTAPLESYKK